MPAAGPALESEPHPIQLSETYRLIGYNNDIKPAITSMAEFALTNYIALSDRLDMVGVQL